MSGKGGNAATKLGRYASTSYLDARATRQGYILEEAERLAPHV